jgi:hypothetical protein
LLNLPVRGVAMTASNFCEAMLFPFGHERQLPAICSQLLVRTNCNLLAPFAAGSAN